MKGLLILDGPTGTELLARGYQAEDKLWTARAAVEAPELLLGIHRDYLEAGANILTANTFRTSAYIARKMGVPLAEMRSLAHASLALATEAIEAQQTQDTLFLAGSLAPLEDCYRPALTPKLEVLEKAHAETAAWLVEGGCDLILAETMGTTREAVTAVKAARRAGAISVAVSFITDDTGRKLLGGDGLIEAARLCAEAGAASILVNCVHADIVGQALEELVELGEQGVALGAYGNADRMTLHFGGGITWEKDKRDVEERAREYASKARQWATVGHAKIIGGCCGTSPAYIRELSRVLRGRL